MRIKFPKRFYMEIDLDFQLQIGLNIYFTRGMLMLNIPFFDLSFFIDRSCKDPCYLCGDTITVGEESTASADWTQEQQDKHKYGFST